MSERPSPDERAWQDAAAEAVRNGLRGDEAVEYADAMRGTFWFQWTALGYALRDVGRAVLDAIRCPR